MKKIIIKSVIFASFLVSSAFANNTAEISASTNIVSQLIKVIVGENKNYTINTIIQNTTPHNYSISYKEALQINEADALFIMDNTFETEIAKAYKGNSLYQLSGAPKIEILPVETHKFFTLSESNSNDNHADHHHHHDDIRHHHGDSGKDYHIWLDPIYSIHAAEYVKDILSEKFPHDAELFNTNFNKYKAETEELHKQIEASLSKVNKNVSFMLAHDGWQYFLKRYNITDYSIFQGSHSLHAHDSNVSISVIRKFRAYVAEKNIACIFGEPQLNNKVLKKIAKDLNITYQEIDPIGNDTTYNDLLIANAQQFAECLN